MSKESATSRIPRMDGGSRIPVPGSIRASNATQLKARPTQLMPPLAKRAQPTATPGLRPPTLVGNSLKKSGSAERINNVVNMVSKKSTTVLKKFFGNKSEKVMKLPQVPQQHKGIVSSEGCTPRPLTRSNTYVCDESQDMQMGTTTHTTIVHSTPAVACETTQLLGHNSTRNLFYTTHFQSKNSPCFGDTIILDSNSPLHRTHTIESMHLEGDQKQQLGNTVCLSSPTNGNLINLTKTLTETDVLGKTMLVNAPSEYLPRRMEQIMNQISLQKAGTGANTALDSPVTNATYSNPGSMENMQMLEDVSVPSCFDLDITLQSHKFSDHSSDNENFCDFAYSQAPDKSHMKLALNSIMTMVDLTKDDNSPEKHRMKRQMNSTMNDERIIDLTKDVDSPSLLLNFTEDHIKQHANNTQLLYMTQLSCSATNTPDCNSKFPSAKFMSGTNMMSPFLMKGAQSEMVLPTRTPDENLLGEPMEVDSTLTAIGARTEEFLAENRTAGVAMSLQDINNPYSKQKARFSFGLDLTESTLDCSIELVDASLSSAAHSQPNAANSTSLSASTQQLQQQFLKKQNSFELDESLGILTPDQMKEFLDSTNTNTNNLELPLLLHANGNNSKMSFHRMRVDQTPSPEELPLDPVEVKTDITDMVLSQHQQSLNPLTAQQRQQYLQSSCNSMEPVSLHTDTEHSKTEQMTKSSVSRISTSFITSVTSVTSLDTGYQGDGEMSRPASRGACDHSPSNGPAVRKVGGHVSRQPSFNQPQPPLPPIRRQDPMTDSDFFTESDADDIFHRGDRRAQVIDGQLYGPMLQQPTASVFITEDPQLEDSCMESSGIFTDVENRCDEDLAQIRRQDTQEATTDMSPDAEDSTETVKSNRDAKAANTRSVENANVEATDGQSKLTGSQTSSTIHSSLSTDRLSAATTLSNRTSYCSVDGNSGGSNGESKSFTSLEAAFQRYAACAGDDGSANVNTMRHAKSTTPGNNALRYADRAPAVPRVSSPRKHASLTSLCSGTSAVYHVARSEAQTPPSGAKNGANAGSISRSTESCAGSGSTGAQSIKSAGKYTPRSLKTTQKYAKSKTSHVDTGATSSPVIVRKPLAPNKWDAVMNKIASNKALIKKNYNDVKSKVSTRGAAGLTTVHGAGGGGAGSAGTGSPSISPGVTASPISRRSPSSVSAGPASPTIGRVLNNARKNGPTKDNVSNGLRLQCTEKTGLLHGNAGKRGRSYSKDSQKSSQSDLSLTSGSPKLLAKTPLRSAKKRDVRNLSISPTDLGPPPKTTQTANGTPTRTKSAVVTITQKRLGTNAASPTPKEASPPKKISFTPKRIDISAKAPTKTPLKDITRERLFCISGSESRTRLLRTQIYQDKAFTLGGGEYSVHDAANVFKQSLVEIPEPLLPDRLLTLYLLLAPMCQAALSSMTSDGTDEPPNENHAHLVLQLVLLLIPERNRNLLRHVVELLNLKARQGDANKLSASNLAVIFVPHLICPRDLPADAMIWVAGKLSSIIQYLVLLGVNAFEVPAELMLDIRTHVLKVICDQQQDAEVSLQLEDQILQSEYSMQSAGLSRALKNYGENFEKMSVADLVRYLIRSHPQILKKWVLQHMSVERNLPLEQLADSGSHFPYEYDGETKIFKRKQKKYNDAAISKCFKSVLESIIDLKNLLLSEENLSVECIFGTSGSMLSTKNLRLQLKNCGPKNMADGEYTVHEYTSLFKQLLAEIPEPLMTDALYNVCLHLAPLCDCTALLQGTPPADVARREQVRTLIQLLMMLLPQRNRVLMEHIIELLHSVTEKAHANKMTAKNVAIIFVPHLFCPRDLPAEALHYATNKLVCLLECMVVMGMDVFEIPAKLAVDLRAKLHDMQGQQTGLRKQEIYDFAISTAYSFFDLF